MAKQVKLTLAGVQVYAQTITDAIADVTRKKKLSTIISDLEGADVLSANVTATTAVGKVASGSTFAQGTNVKDVVSAILSFETPSFTTLKVTADSTDYSSSTNLFCSSTAMSLTKVTHKEANIGSIKDSKIKLSLNGTESEEDASASEVGLTKSASIARNTNKASYTVTLKGTNTLGAAMSNKSVTLSFYMPVYTFVAPSQTEEGIKGGLADATAKTTVYTGTHNIDETITVTGGSTWCVAVPSHLGMSGIGTIADFGFGTQKTTTTTYNTTREVNGIANVAYTIYTLAIDTDQTNLGVRFASKAK